jgi:hypothetical protein
MCHGTDGRGTGASGNVPGIPDFTLRAWQDRRGDPQLAVSILDGKGKSMPSFRGKLDRGQARELVAFIRSFDPSRAAGAVAGKPPVSPPAAGDFEARYRQLRDEFDDLSRQMRSLSPAPRTSRATRR